MEELGTDIATEDGSETMNAIRPIPLDAIAPLEGQPRQYFDPAALAELSASIAAHGQYTPAWVSPLPGGAYRLIAGERRWRACKLAGLATLLCEVREGLTEDQQYLASVMENFGRRDTTVMETARSIGRVLAMQGGDHAKTAAVFARSEAWVRQLSMLLRLEPEVAAMLEPPAPSLTTQTAVSLANLQPDVQKRLASEISLRGMRHRQALAHVRSSVVEADRVRKQGRRPSQDHLILTRFLGSLGQGAQALLGLGDDRLRGLFAHRDAKSRATVVAALRKRAAQLESLAGVLE